MSISLLLVSKCDLLMSVSLLLVSKSDFLVADGLASFSDDPSTLRRTPTWPSARVRRPHHSKSKNFFKNFHERCIFRPVSRVSKVEGSFFALRHSWAIRAAVGHVEDGRGTRCLDRAARRGFFAPTTSSYRPVL